MSSQLGKIGRSAHSDRPGKPARRVPRRPRVAPLAAVVGVLLTAVALPVWYTSFRPISVTVNGKEASIRIHASVQDLLDAHDAFGVKPGRLVSVGGNVLDEQGGTVATVLAGTEAIGPEAYATREVAEGESFTVSDGTDLYEEHESAAEELQPGVRMETGGAIQFISQWGKAGKREVWTGKRSGETADRGVTEEPVEMVVSSYNPAPAADGKSYIALTFDDGPGKDTAGILDILSKKGVRATFFNLGLNAQNNPALAKRVVEDGHEMASHTNQHMNLPKQNAETLRSEITSARDRIGAASGVSPQMIRAPYGAFTLADWQRAGDLISCNVLWNIDTLDWKRPGADAIAQTVLSQARNGAIVLMHDGGGDRSQDVEALPAIIDGLKERGYTFVTVTELMKLDGRFPEAVVNGQVSVPEGCIIPPVG